MQNRLKNYGIGLLVMLLLIIGFSIDSTIVQILSGLMAGYAAGELAEKATLYDESQSNDNL